MPIYSYECPVCKAKVDQMRAISDMDKEEECPDDNCTGTLKKLLLVGNVISKNVPNR